AGWFIFALILMANLLEVYGVLASFGLNKKDESENILRRSLDFYFLIFFFVFSLLPILIFFSRNFPIVLFFIGIFVIKLLLYIVFLNSEGEQLIGKFAAKSGPPAGRAGPHWQTIADGSLTFALSIYCFILVGTIEIFWGNYRFTFEDALGWSPFFAVLLGMLQWPLLHLAAQKNKTAWDWLMYAVSIYWIGLSAAVQLCLFKV
ncbi:MAG: hypothetical protein QME05_03705, partial [Candidatus Margulisbacteria bacterium]|nr:hypothetical protein [Candidatus Margulisiibacteriota bacterium]